jgi:hypothetical protein
MTKISSSPARDRFSISFEENKDPIERKWHEYDMEYDLRTTDWILEKVRNSESYAQHLYAAMCNNAFQKIEVLPILKNQKWSCSWRHSGGIIADMLENGDYLDWYCSGMGGVIASDDGLDYEGNEPNGYVAEGRVTQEVMTDLRKLNWAVVTEKNNDDDN